MKIKYSYEAECKRVETMSNKNTVSDHVLFVSK